MKKLKLNLFMVAAFAIAAVTMSFKMANTSSLAGEKWFEYTDETGDGDTSNPENYVLANGNGNSLPPCPDGNTEVCAVQAQPITGDTDHPNLNTVIKTERRAQQ